MSRDRENTPPRPPEPTASGPTDEYLLWVAEARTESAAGDRAFTRLVELYRSRVVSLVAAHLGDADQAEDVAQEVFLKARAALPSVREEARFESWLLRIAYRTAIDHTRGFWWRRRVSLERLAESARETALAGAAVAGAGNDPESTLLRSERSSQVRKALREVPEAFRAPVVLRDIAGLSYEEIGRILNCPLGTVESRIHRGRQALRRKLEKLLP
ncbi:MAG: sigma-70 family RNA polymerase sigma factor [Deltaproteobacteria bacterium]|nr:sigma-70 family RNA polymerase sigma factor [Deltaproteobacteria bacterium]